MVSGKKVNSLLCFYNLDYAEFHCKTTLRSRGRFKSRGHRLNYGCNDLYYRYKTNIETVQNSPGVV